MEPRVFAGKYHVGRELGDLGGARTLLTVGPGGVRAVVEVVHPASETAAADLEREVSLISGIRHVGLPMVHEWGHEDGDFFVVRDYIPGADLEMELEQQGLFAPMTAARYGAMAAAALAEIHRRGLVHGNVKTANIIRTPEDEIFVVGNSLALADPGLSPGATPADAHYLAPEQIEGGAQTAATDVYAMGVVLYELITGHVPFDGPTAAAVADRHVHTVPASIAERVPDVPPALDAVVMRALEKSPGARFGDGEALRSALSAVYQPVQASPEPTVPAARRTSPWPWLLAALLLVLAGLGIAWGLGAFAPARQATVPSVVGMTQSDAQSALAQAGLQVGVVTFAGAPVNGIADGSVSAQSPAQGAKVDPATKVDLVIAGAQAITVPDVVGLTQTQATIDLQQAGLVTGTVSNVATTGVGAGMVLGQAPAAGAKVAKGTAVDLQVSQGSVAVPSVTDMTQANAKTALEAAGFGVAVRVRSSVSVPTGRVIEQNPTAGVTAQPGSTVTIIVSTGPGLVSVPDVVTMTQVDAVNALNDAGFKSKIVLQTGGGTVGTVIDQNPNAGVKAASGSTVQITVVQ